MIKRSDKRIGLGGIKIWDAIAMDEMLVEPNLERTKEGLRTEP